MNKEGCHRAPLSFISVDFTTPLIIPVPSPIYQFSPRGENW